LYAVATRLQNKTQYYVKEDYNDNKNQCDHFKVYKISDSKIIIMVINEHRGVNSTQIIKHDSKCYHWARRVNHIKKEPKKLIKTILNTKTFLSNLVIIHRKIYNY